MNEHPLTKLPPEIRAKVVGLMGKVQKIIGEHARRSRRAGEAN